MPFDCSEYSIEAAASPGLARRRVHDAAYAVTASWMIPEMYNERLTWHAMIQSGDHQLLTAPGVWELIFESGR